MSWQDRLDADPLPWLLEKNTPSVRAAALQRLCGMTHGESEVLTAQRAARRCDPIRSILAAQ